MKLPGGPLSIIALVILLGACRQDSAPPGEAGGTASAHDVASVRGAPAQAAAAREATARPQVPTSAQEGHPEMLTLADAVAKQGDGPALALAAMLRDGALQGAGPEGAAGPHAQRKRMDDKVREWLDEAQRRAPDEATVLVLAVYLERYDEARRQALVARWRVLEPRNLVPLLYATLPESSLFEAAATTSVYDSHYDDVLRLVIDTLSRTPSPALARLRAATPGLSQEALATSIAITFWAVAGVPPFQRVVAPCRAGTLSDARRRECRWVAEVLLRRSDTVISEMAGAGMIARGLGTVAEQAEAELYRREGDWLMACMGQVQQRNPGILARRYAQLILGGAHATERMVVRQIAIESGFPPSPPAGWRRGRP